MLRLLDPERDGPALHAVFGDPECCRYMLDEATGSFAETIRLLTDWTRGTEDTSWAIVESHDGPALGRLTLIPRGQDVWEAGITLSPAAQGRGLAYGAMTQALGDVFNTRGARRVFADIDPDNTPSIQLFERLGFQHEGRLRAAWKTHLGVRDSIIMGLIDRDPKPWA